MRGSTIKKFFILILLSISFSVYAGDKGKKGKMIELFAAFKEVPNESKKEFGQAINTLKQNAKAKVDVAAKAAINIAAKGQTKIEGAMTEVAGKGMVTIKGGMTMIN